MAGCSSRAPARGQPVSAPPPNDQAPLARANETQVQEHSQRSVPRSVDLTKPVVPADTVREPLRLTEPPDRYTLVEAVAVASQVEPRLTRLSARRNQVTDVEAWFADNQLTIPTWRVPASVPQLLLGRSMRLAVGGDDRAFVLYTEHSKSDLGLIFKGADPVAAFDFETYSRPPKGDFQFDTIWGVIAYETLFVSHGHRTYAKTSGGINAFISAIDLSSGRLRWRSRPLVSNSRNFIVRDGYIVTG